MKKDRALVLSFFMVAGEGFAILALVRASPPLEAKQRFRKLPLAVYAFSGSSPPLHYK